MLSGTALITKEMAPECRVIGVEPTAGDDATRSFKSGTLQSVHNPATVADGFRTHMAMHAAEGALYRDCVAEACESLGFTAVVLAADELPPTTC